jgi:mRNA-degrading endonuclease RelE of RelBE toxin-antitoxin system
MAWNDESPWSVKLTSIAQRDMDELNDSVRAAALEVLGVLEDDPFPYGSNPLRGYTNLYRVKFYRDAYRLIYSVSEKKRLVIVERIRPRATAYDGMRDPRHR